MRKDIKWITLIFFIAFIPKCFIALQMIPYSVYDEFGSMASAAYIAGKDWSDILSEGAYYGFGYYMFFWPIFFLTDNPYLIYKLVCLVNAVVQASCGLICYAIVSRFLGEREKYLKNSIISVLCSYLVTVRVNAYNENGLVLVTWITALFLCFLVTETDEKRKRLLSFLVFGVAVYSLTIHTRAVILVVALVAMSILYRIVYKRDLFSKISYIFAGAVFVIARMVIKIVQSLLWKSDGDIHNASIDLSKHLGGFNFLDVNAWKAIIYIIIGQLNSLNIFSGGILITSIILALRYIIKQWERRSKPDASFFVIYGTFMACLAGMIVGLSITWGDGVSINLLSNLRNQDGYKAFSYVRYACAYMGPVILCGLIMLSNKAVCSKKYIFFITGFNIIIYLFWFVNIVPLISESLNAFEVFVPLAFRKPMQAINMEMYYRITGWFIAFIGALFLLALFRMEKTYMLLITGFLCFEFIFTGYYNDVYYGPDHSKMAIASYDFLQKILEENEGFILEEIYMYNGDYLREQFYFNHLRIIKDIPDASVKNAILLYTGDILQEQELQSLINIDEYSVVKADKNIYILAKGEEFVSYINQSGYSVEDLAQLMGN